jgi:hypothetical protein
MSRISSLKKLALAVATTAFAATSLAVISPSPAQAASGFTIRLAPASNPFVYADVDGASTDTLANVVLWSLRGDSQVWTFQPYNSSYLIVNKHSGKCIWTDGVAGDQLRQVPCDGNPYELWDTALTPGNIYTSWRIKAHSFNLYLEVKGGGGSNGSTVDVWPYNGGQNQFWSGLGA